MKQCRACNSKLDGAFLSLGNSPLSNSFLSESDLDKEELYYPLDVYLCENCYLVQIGEFVPADEIFSSDYAYFSSYSDSWLRHCKGYTEMMIERFGFNRDSFVVEIGSNDGYLLQFFKEAGIRSLGVEPTSNTARIAIEKGIPTDIEFFNVGYAEGMIKNRGKADLILFNNVLAHNPNLNEFVAGLRIALKNDGVITAEFPHLLRLIEDNQFDTIYQEHFSYFSFIAAQKLFASHDLEIFDVDEIGTHGGSLRIYARHKEDESKGVTRRVRDLLDKERAFGLLDLETYHRFSESVRAIKRETLSLLIGLKEQGKRIVGYGAPAKGNTLLNFYGVRTDFLDYTVDRSPHKQEKYLPGTHIPVKSPEQIRVDKPDYVFILPWNIREEIMGQMSCIREWGGRFIIPIPRVEVL
ncbi:MAG: SAM-dependent methyltransferase [Candidatus Solincola sediminis]|nr:MAG: SAM-dependent methyltransferase [Candidatus Solincola sediminis]